MNSPYKYIGEATPECAFLTSADEHDVAVLRRISNDPPTPNDEEWQRMIWLIDAAPKLLNVVVRLHTWLEMNKEINQEHMNQHDLTVLDDAIAEARMARDLALGKAPQTDPEPTNKERTLERFRDAAARSLDAVKHCHYAMHIDEVDADLRLRAAVRAEWTVADMNVIIGADQRINNPIA